MPLRKVGTSFGWTPLPSPGIGPTGAYRWSAGLGRRTPPLSRGPHTLNGSTPQPVQAERPRRPHGGPWDRPRHSRSPPGRGGPRPPYQQAAIRVPPRQGRRPPHTTAKQPWPPYQQAAIGVPPQRRGGGRSTPTPNNPGRPTNRRLSSCPQAREEVAPHPRQGAPESIPSHGCAPPPPPRT